MHNPSHTPDLSAEQARALLRYEPETGKLFWRERSVEVFADARAAASWNSRYAGTEAFTSASGRGYRQGNILGALYRAHRVIWLLQTGRWPEEQVDHINGRRDDNRWVNLREATRSQNQRNQKRRSDNTTGTPGLWWFEARQKWQLKVCRKTVGYFDTKEEAIAARAKINDRYGFSPRHGDQVLDLC